MPGSGTFSTQYRGVLGALDDWENNWFDVADAALSRLYPAVHAVLFKNLSKVSGSEVVLTVKTFVERIGSMRKDGGEETQKALALLEKRGLTPDRIDEARALLGKVAVAQTGAKEEEEVDDAPLKAEREAAVEAMWGWYQDWAKTARTVVKNRNYLVMLGLTQIRGGGATEDVADDAAEDDVASISDTAKNK
jgi:hypothetical protein